MFCFDIQHFNNVKQLLKIMYDALYFALVKGWNKSNGVCYDKLRRKIFGEGVELLEVKDIPGYLRN